MGIGGIIIGALVIGLIVALVGTSVLKSELHSVAPKTQANSYIVPGSLNIKAKNESFLYSRTEKTEKPQQESKSES